MRPVPTHHRPPLPRRLAAFLKPEWKVLVTFIPFGLLAAGFFAAPATFVFFLLPFGGLYYFFLSNVIGGLALLFQIGPEYVGLGDGILTLLAVTGTTYLYFLSCYISHVWKRKNDRPRQLMIISLAGIFVSPFILLYVPPVLAPYQPANPPIISITAETCGTLSMAVGSTYWNAETRTCTVNGIFVPSADHVLQVGNGTTLEITGADSRFEYSGFYTLHNEGTISLTGGATFVNVLDLGDPENPRQAIFQNGGLLATDNDSRIINQGRIDVAELTGRITNDGLFDNRGEIISNGAIENSGLLTNSGYITIYNTDTTVRAGKQATIKNSGKIQNLDSLDVGGGVFYNQATGIVENYGKLQVGVLHNYSTVENVNGYAAGEKIYNYCGGKVVGLVEIPTQLSC